MIFLKIKSVFFVSKTCLIDAEQINDFEKKNGMKSAFYFQKCPQAFYRSWTLLVKGVNFAAEKNASRSDILEPPADSPKTIIHSVCLPG